MTLAQKLYSKAPLKAMGGVRGVRFKCRCSAERITDTMRLLTAVDLDELIAEGFAEATCNFCNTTYRVLVPELEGIRAEVARRPRENN